MSFSLILTCKNAPISIDAQRRRLEWQVRPLCGSRLTALRITVIVVSGIARHSLSSSSMDPATELPLDLTAFAEGCAARLDQILVDDAATSAFSGVVQIAW